MTHRIPRCMVLVALLIASVPALHACGHHGHVASDTELFANLHLKHKQLLRGLEQEYGLAPESTLDQSAELQSIHNSMQGATAEEAPLLAQLLHSRRSAMQDSSITNPGTTAPIAASQPAQIATPVRLHVEFQDAGSQDPAHTTLVAITNTVVRVLQTYLSVRAPTIGPLLVSPMCYESDGSRCTKFYPPLTLGTPSLPANDSLAMCGAARINPAHILDTKSCTSAGATCKSMAGTASGVATDMYLYVTSVTDSQCSDGAAAWARPCLFDPKTNRPVMGTANVCPLSLSTDPDTLVAVMMHEVMHALGFTSALFRSYIDPLTNQELGQGAISATSTVGGMQVTRVISPTVKREARAQFGCPTLDGAQLEDEGGTGSQNSHWEYTHYQGELMLASAIFSTAGEAPRLSRLTLALMEDSGWYLGNWTAVGGPLQWGRDTGCTLPAQGCKQFIATTTAAKQQNMFCDAAAATAQGSKLRYMTSPSYKSVGQCRSGRNVSFSNSCDMVVARGYMPSCTSPLYQYVNPESYGWYHGPTSRAFPVNYMFEVSLNDGRGSYLYFPSTGTEGDKDAVCYPTTCQGGQVFLSIAGQQVRCPTGQYVSLAAKLPGVFRRGTIGPCPDEAKVCSTLDCGGRACSAQGGSCYDGACVCKLGWTGSDCSFSILRNARAPDAPSPALPAPADAPAPPAMLNVTNWYQQVTLTYQLTGSTLAGVQDRKEQLLAVVAAWAEVPSAQLQLANASLVLSNNTASQVQQDDTGAGGAHDHSEDVEEPFPELEAQMVSKPAPPSPGRRLLVLEAGGHPGARVAARAGAVAAEPAGLQAQAGRLVRRMTRMLLDLLASDLASAGAGSSDILVTILIRPSSTLQTTLLMNRLADGLQQQQLAAQLAAADFTMVAGSLRTTLSILQETISVPATAPIAENTTNQAKATQQQSADSSESLSWNVVIAAVAVGAGAVVLIGVVVAVAYYRTRAARLKADKQALQQAAAEVQQRQPPIILQPGDLKLPAPWNTPPRAATPPRTSVQLFAVAGEPSGRQSGTQASVSSGGGSGSGVGRSSAYMDVNPMYSSPMRRGL